MTPCSAAPVSNSLDSKGSATPVMKTTNPSKNFPAAANDQIGVIGADARWGSVRPHWKLVYVVLHRSTGVDCLSVGDVVHMRFPLIMLTAFAGRTLRASGHLTGYYRVEC
jgi:hypothetical protein